MEAFSKNPGILGFSPAKLIFLLKAALDNHLNLTSPRAKYWLWKLLLGPFGLLLELLGRGWKLPESC